MHIETHINLEQLDLTTIEDCSHSGACDSDVSYHRQRLGLTVDRGNAIQCLEQYGAWSYSELILMTNEDLAEIILWVACGDFKEYLENLKEGYPTDECPQGADVFCLD